MVVEPNDGVQFGVGPHIEASRDKRTNHNATCRADGVTIAASSMLRFDGEGGSGDGGGAGRWEQLGEIDLVAQQRGVGGRADRDGLLALF